MNPFKTFTSTSARSLPSSRELSPAEIIAVSGGTGQMNPIHRPTPHPILPTPIIYVPITNPSPIRHPLPL